MYQVIIKNTVSKNKIYSDVSFDDIPQAERYIENNKHLYPGFELDIIPAALNTEPKQVSLFSDLLEIKIGMKCDLTNQLSTYWDVYNRNMNTVLQNQKFMKTDLTPWYHYIKESCSLKDTTGAMRCADRDFLLNNKLIKLERAD